MIAPKEKLIVALDVKDTMQAAEVLKKLKGLVSTVKIGLELFTREGKAVVERTVGEGFKVFLDLKFHDIPNTVRKAVEQVAKFDIFMTNVHALGGFEMMKEAKNGLDKATEGKKEKPLLIAVTVLTSHTEESFNHELGIGGSLTDGVLRFANLAQKAGLDGVVASPREIALIKENIGPDFKVITPGIRPLWAAGTQDQKRIMTPQKAIQMGADYIVVGRPILDAPDIREAAKRTLDEMGEIK